MNDNEELRNEELRNEELRNEELRNDEDQYLTLIREIMDNGSEEITRNGSVLSMFGCSMRFSLRDGTMPLLTTKRVAWKTCFNELRWFIRGSTSNDELNSDNVKIWNMNSTREFLDQRGLSDNRVGDLGPVYGHQWRHYNAPYDSCDTDYTGKGVDQLKIIIDTLMDPAQRSSRRIVMTCWNPQQIDEMALPPCHVLVQFNVRKGMYLSCALYQRSGDVGLGVPFNIASYSFLTHIIAKHCGLIPEEFVYFLGNAHIYREHIDPLKNQIGRKPFRFPKIRIKEKYEEIERYTIDDIEWKEEYLHHGNVKMVMVA